MTGVSSVYSMAHADALEGAEADRRNAEMYQRAWQEHGLFCVRPETIDDEWVRQVIINLAESRYLKRGKA